jgi:hypothetical protein
MATLPTVEDAAKHIVATFISSGARPGYVLSERCVIRAFWSAPWSPDDFEPGLDFAINQGWIERAPSGEFRLTQAGFGAT